MTEAEAYLILGLPQNADAGRIRKKYRELIVLAHPDSVHARRVNHAGTGQTSHASGSLKMHIPDSEKFGQKETVPDARQINLAYSVVQRSGKDSCRAPFEKKANVPGDGRMGMALILQDRKSKVPGDGLLRATSLLTANGMCTAGRKTWKGIRSASLPQQGGNICGRRTKTSLYF